MIVREDGDQLVLVRQTDHALLSGWLAGAWGAPPWSVPRPYDSTVVAARLHDLAWTTFDEALPRRPDGRPYAFHEVAREVSTRLYGQGLDAVEAVDPYAGLLASLHYSGFFTSHWGWRHGHQPPSLDPPQEIRTPPPRFPGDPGEGEEGEAIRRFVAQEQGRQRRLRDRLGVHVDQDRELMCNYFWLQLWDRISLDVCRYGFTGWSGDYPAAPLSAEPGAETVRLHVELEPGGVCRLDPYPLLPCPYRARIPAVRVPLAVAGDLGELRRAWRAGGADAIEVTFRPR